MEVSHQEIWQTLSRVDVSDHIEEKGGLSYLSWAWAWGVLMEHYPQAEFHFLTFSHPVLGASDHRIYPNGTAAVECVVVIGEVSREMWLPVMDFRNKAISEPDARAISDSKMRCLVKCLALLGLGHYIYAGEDTPSEANGEKESPPAATKKKVARKKKQPEEKEVVEGVVNSYKVFLETAKTMDELRQWWLQNRDELKKMEADLPDTYTAVLAAFSERKNQLKEE